MRIRVWGSNLNANGEPSPLGYAGKSWIKPRERERKRERARTCAGRRVWCDAF